MELLLDILLKVLKQDERFVSNEWILLKNTIREKAENLDSNLISLLLDNEVLREKFFLKIKDIIVFDNNKFIKFINNKAFLPDSYTSFKNKIGLTTEKGDFIASSNEVVLSFPFKDCVLAWWQDKEDIKRDEVFYNEILWQDDIDRLLDKKVFTNFKRIDKNWEHKLEWFNRDENGTISDNLIIKWNNLLALHSLKSNFAGKVKLIYIDPPYNTWNDSFNYNDKFNHSTWLTFMKNRLEVAKELLRDDWAIFVQCDDNEQAYLKVLMDEIFWIWSFRECITVKTSTPSWVNAVNVKRWERLFKLKEYVLFYSRKELYRFNPIYIKTDYNENYKYEVVKNWNNYLVKDLSKEFSNKEGFIKYCLKNNENIYSLEKNNKKAWEKIKVEIEKSLNNENVIEFTNSKDSLVLIYNWWVFVPLKERIVKEWNNNYFWTLISDFWDDEIFQSTKTEWWVDFSNAKKPEKLLKRILELWSKEWDIILDYHLWSASTCAVAHKMKRQYIWIEQMDYIETISVERMKKVIEWEQWWISKTVNWQGGWEFVYMEIMQENERFIDEIKNAKNIKNLLEIYNQIEDSEFINYKVDIWNLKFDNLEAKDFEDFKLFLIEILDKNLLYKNYSEKNDKNNNINIDEKKLNNLLYSNF